MVKQTDDVPGPGLDDLWWRAAASGADAAEREKAAVAAQDFQRMRAERYLLSGGADDLRGFVVQGRQPYMGDCQCKPVGHTAEVAMRVAAENLAQTLFRMFLASGADPRSDEFWDRVAQIEIVGEDEDEIVERLGDLRDMIEAAMRRH